MRITSTELQRCGAGRATVRRQDAETIPHRIGVKLPGVQGGQQRLGVQMRHGGVQGLCQGVRGGVHEERAAAARRKGEV